MSGNATPSGTSKQNQLRSPFWQRNWLWGLFLIALVSIAYTRVFNAGFIWDDESHLTQNPCIIGPLGLKEIWTSARAVYYPLVLTSFWSLDKLVGLSPSPCHSLNVVLHAGSAVLLWRVLRQLDVRGASLGAVLWALHPVMVQSVAWVTELKNTQSCLFYLLSIFWFLKVDAEENGNSVRWWRFGWALLFFVVAVLSKPSTVMLPVVIALCVWWRRGRVRWRDLATLVPFALISALASVWTIWEQKFHSGATGSEWAQLWPERLIIAGRAMWFYLGKLIWPDPLIFIYPRWEINSLQLTAYLPLLAALAGLFALWLIRGKWSRPVFFAAAYFVISLFPVLGFFTVYFFRYSFVSDHFQYLASMGPLALAGAGITAGTDSLKWKPFLCAAMCGILLLFGFLTWRQSGIYHDLVTLYTATLAKNPGCWMAHYNLGIVLRDQGETGEAIAHYRQAVALRPNYAEAQYNLASVLLRKGRTDEAIDHYRKTLELHPENADAHANLGSAFLAKDRIQEAIAQYRDSLAIAPENVAAQSNLAWLLATSADASLRNGPEAVLLAQQASRHSGANRPVILRILAAAYCEAGHFAEAKETAQKAFEPSDGRDNTVLADALRKEIALYQSGLPFHKQSR